MLYNVNGKKNNTENAGMDAAPLITSYFFFGRFCTAAANLSPPTKGHCGKPFMMIPEVNRSYG